MDIWYILLTSLLSALFGYLRFQYQYWELENVPQLKMHFLFGNFFRLKSMHLSELLHEVYRQYRGLAQVVGTYIFTKPIAVIMDLDIIRRILNEDVNKFTDPFEECNQKYDPFSDNLHIANKRAKLTPDLQWSKMKFIFPSSVIVARQLQEAFEEQLNAATNGVIEVDDLCARFTTDVIAKCALSLECNSLKDPHAEFGEIAKSFFYPNYMSVRFRILLLTYPKLYQLFHRYKGESNRMDEFVRRVVRDTVKMREERQIERDDFVNMLIELKKDNPCMTIEEMAAQVFIFFVVAFEASASNLACALYELAKTPRVQEKLRKEILRVLKKYHGDLCKEAMKEMRYLDQVLSETLRKYPAFAALTRVANEDYELPGTKITLDKGTSVYIPLRELQYDPDLYDKPQDFQPERFEGDNKEKRQPPSLLGIGTGPRHSIGFRLARIHTSVGLITLLKSYKFQVCAQTPEELKISNNSPVMVPQGGVWLKIEKI